MAQVESKWSFREVTARYGRSAASAVIGFTVLSFLDRIDSPTELMTAVRHALDWLIGVEVVLLVLLVAALHVSRHRAGGPSAIQNSLFNLGLSLVLLVGAAGPPPNGWVFELMVIVQTVSFAGALMDTYDVLIASLRPSS